jgi:hypothetical protein
MSSAILKVRSELLAWSRRRAPSVRTVAQLVANTLERLNASPDDPATREQIAIDIECLRLVARQERTRSAANIGAAS